MRFAVGGGEHPDIDLHGGRAADPIDHPLLQRAQQFRLQADIHLGDFVEQQRAAIGFLEPADPAGNGAGEGALLVAEQFGFEQSFRDRGAVDRDEGPARTGSTSYGRAGRAPPYRCRSRR